ncbi:MAG TPA: cytochrome c [Terracidiphilus sp.]|jgi:mono/diheme cytochrome c family protein
MLKSFLLFFAVALLAIAFLPLQGRSSQQATPEPGPALTPPQTAATPPAAPTRNPVKPTAESQAKAKAIYGIDCAVCHGDNGNGKSDVATSMGMTLGDWTKPATLAGLQDSDLFSIIRNGKDKMPPETEGRATDAEVWNLVIYIRSFSNPQAAAPAPAH